MNNAIQCKRLGCQFAATDIRKRKNFCFMSILAMCVLYYYWFPLFAAIAKNKQQSVTTNTFAVCTCIHTQRQTDRHKQTTHANGQNSGKQYILSNKMHLWSYSKYSYTLHNQDNGSLLSLPACLYVVHYTNWQTERVRNFCCLILHYFGITWCHPYVRMYRKSTIHRSMYILRTINV